MIIMLYLSNMDLAKINIKESHFKRMETKRVNLNKEHIENERFYKQEIELHFIYNFYI